MHTTKCSGTTFIYDGDPRGGVVIIRRNVHGPAWPKHFRHIPTGLCLEFHSADETQRLPGLGLLTAAECSERPNQLEPLDAQRNPSDNTWAYQEVQVPTDALLEFVGSLVRSARISALEVMNTETILGIKP